MPAKKSAKKGTQPSPNNRTAPGGASKGFSADERAAMREHARELKDEARRAAGGGTGSDEDAVLAKIAAMAPADRTLAERFHALIEATAPELAPRLWYGMPAYAKDGKVVCFFQDAKKFKTRYATLGFSDKASLDEGHMWPTSYALKELSAADETRIAALVRKAVS